MPHDDDRLPPRSIQWALANAIDPGFHDEGIVTLEPPQVVLYDYETEAS